VKSTPCYPKTWRDAITANDAADLIEGLKEKMTSLKAHNVSTMVPRHSVPPGFQIIKSRPHCHLKNNEKNEVVLQRVRVVAKGYMQVPGVDFEEMFTPVTCLESIWSMLHIEVMNYWDINHLDIKTSFLHGDFDEELYISNLKEPRK